MADHAPPVAPDDSEIRFRRERLDALLVTLERMASGDAGARLPITAAHDTLDAIAYAVNVLVSELEWAGNRTRKVLEERADELRAAVDSAEARNGALLKAIPDLMFVLQTAKPGTDVKITFVRDGKQQSVTATYGVPKARK